MSAALKPNQIVRLKNNGVFNAAKEKRGEQRIRFQPVVRMTARDGREWLLFEIDPDNDDHVFAECRRPGKTPEMTWILLSWLGRQDVKTSQRFGRVRKVAV